MSSYACRVAALLAAALFASANPAVAQQKISIFTGVSAIFAPVYIAEIKGYFKEEKIDATVKAFTSGADATEGFRSGGAQFLIASDVPLIYQLAGGDATLLAQFSLNTGMLIMVGKEPVAKVGDLKGKKVGLVRRSGSEYMLQAYLKTGGLTLKDVEMVHLAPADQIPAIARGDVQALSTWKPFHLRLAAVAKDSKILVENGPVGYMLYSGMVTRKAFLTPENKDTVVGVLRAIKRGADYMAKADLDAVSKELAAHIKTQVPDVKEVIKDNSWSMANDAAFRKAFGEVAAFLRSQDLIKQDIDLAKVSDWSYLKAVDPKLVQD